MTPENTPEEDISAEELDSIYSNSWSTVGMTEDEINALIDDFSEKYLKNKK